MNTFQELEITDFNVFTFCDEDTKIITFCADIIINDKYVIQRGTDGEYSIDDDDYCCIDGTGKNQEIFYEKYNDVLDDIIEKFDLENILIESVGGI